MNGDPSDLRQILQLAQGSAFPRRQGSQSGDVDDLTPESLGLPDEDDLEYDDIENPLQLLARASDLQRPSPQNAKAVSTPRTPYDYSGANHVADVDEFFLPLRATLDIDDGTKLTEFDPVTAGLVTMEEAQSLLSFFHDKLAHTRWGLDPAIHSFEFVRSRSAFLLTSMMASSALFIAGAEALSRRLQRHRDWLAKQVIVRQLRSVEIVLAFLVNIPWMSPGQHAADDNTGLYISTALSIALDLSLEKIVKPSMFLSKDHAARISNAHCIDAKKALSMDGFEELSVESELARRLLCRRERAWIALFVLERGVCLARGRSYSVPLTPLLQSCDQWLANGMAHKGDAAMLSMAVLRRDLDGLFDSVRSRCDSYRVIDVGSKVAEEIETTINHFYDRWLAAWTHVIGEGDQQSLPPYVEILVTHTRLSTYGGVINHPTAPLEVKRLFRASTLSSALNVMRVAIQGETRLSSMPNNTVIMISFAACVAMQLSTGSSSTNSQLAPSIWHLVEEIASVLERIGKITVQRNGIAKLYSQYLKKLLQRTTTQNGQTDASASAMMQAPLQDGSTMPAFFQQPMQQVYPGPSEWMEPLPFSAMSDSEILQSVLNAAPDFNMMPDLAQPTLDYTWNFMNPPDFGF